MFPFIFEYIHPHHLKTRNIDDSNDRQIKRSDKDRGNPGHNRSRSMDYHPIKQLSLTPPNKRKGYVDPYLQGSNKSLGSLLEESGVVVSRSPNKLSRNNSGRSSACSADSDSSSRGNHSDVNLLGGHRHRKSPSSSAKGYSSEESRRRSSGGYTSGEKSRDGGESLVSQAKSSLSNFIGLSSSPTWKRSDGDKGTRRKGERRGSGGGKRPSSGSGDNSQHQGQNLSRSHHSSSDGTGRKKTSTPLIIYRDDDPTYIHYSLDYHLNTEVFDSSRGEIFKMVFRSQIISYGEPGELPVLVILSNLRLYVYQIVAPERYAGLYIILSFYDCGIPMCKKLLRICYGAYLQLYTYIITDLFSYVHACMHVYI